MQRRKFFLTPVALASLWGCAQPAGQAVISNGVKSAQVPLEFSKLAVGGEPIWRNLRTIDPGIVTVKVDLWLKLDIEPPPSGGVLIGLNIRITEDYVSGRRPLLETKSIEGKSGPNSNIVHIVGSAEGFSHDDLFRPLALDFGIDRAQYYNPSMQTGATVSTVPGKISTILVTTE